MRQEPMGAMLLAVTLAACSGTPVKAGRACGRAGNASVGDAGPCPVLCGETCAATCDGCTVPCQLAQCSSGYPGCASLAVDSENLYFTDGDGSSGFLKSTPLSGGPVVTLASGSAIDAVAVEGEKLFWMEEAPPLISANLMTNDGCDGVAQTLSTTPCFTGPSFIATASGLYFVACNELVRVDPGGGAPVSIAQWNGPFAFTSNASAVAWLRWPGEVVSLPLGGATAVTLASASYAPYAIAADASNLYWQQLSESGQNYVLMKIPLAGGVPSTLAAIPHDAMANWGAGPPLQAILGDSVYWLSPSAVIQAPLAGGDVVTLVETGPVGGVISIISDATSLYWIEDRAPPGVVGTRIMKLTPP